MAIDQQRSSLETAISLLYCLHSALRREIDDAGRIESQAVTAASNSADLTHISALLMERLDAIHRGLDSLELEQASPDPEMVKLIETVREIGGDASADTIRNAKAGKP
jgi:hypothetical protein